MDVEIELFEDGWYWWILEQEDSPAGPFVTQSLAEEDARNQCMIIEEGCRWDAWEQR